jgi:hypothetical protein
MSQIETRTHLNRDGTITFERHQEVGDILKDNKEAHKEGDEDTSFGRRVANIPNIVIEQWMKEGLNLFDLGKDPEVKRKLFLKLNSPEWKYLRTHNSRL